MKPEDPRFHLSSHREGLDPKAQPELDPLLRKLAEDPALADWHRRDQDGDRLLREKLSKLSPPADLRAQILAGRRAPAQRRLWTAPRLLAAAASVAVLLGVGALLWRSQHSNQNESAALDAFIVKHVLLGEHGGHGTTLAALQTQLGDTRVPLGKALNINLAALRSDGCLRLDFAGRELMELCFVRDGIEYHLYLLPQSGEPGNTTIRITRREGLAIAHWSDAQHQFALATDDKAGVFDKLF